MKELIHMAQGDGLSRKTSEKFLNIIAFGVFSFVGYTLYNATMSAAEDILAGTILPTSIVYFCGIGPYFLGTLLLPIFIDKISPLLGVSVTFFLEASGIILVAFLQIREAKLIGICLISAARSFTDVGFLSLTALYEEVTARAFTAGAGIGVAFGAIYYTGREECLSGVYYEVEWWPLPVISQNGVNRKKCIYIWQSPVYSDRLEYIC